jgi:hypothetical protein
MEELSAMSADQKEFLRTQAKHDLYVLGKGILGYRDVNVQTHGAFCRFIQSEKKRRRLGLMPRTHLKTTLGTITDSVRIPLSDVHETRILIGGETATTAEKFLSEVKGHFEKGKILRFLFPELIPTRFAGPGVQWSANMATLVRNTAYKEATWEAVGVGGAIVGGHFNRIKCDDLIGFEASRSDAKMQEAIEWADNIEALLINQHTDVVDFIGTRWKRNDLYSHIMKFYGQRIAVFVREAIEGGEVIFPGMHSLEVFETLQREKPLLWYSQYQNNPLAAGQTDFPVGAIQSFTFDLDDRLVLRMPDGGYKIWRLEDCDRIVTADPNSGSATAEDTAAVVASAITPDNEIVVLASWADRVSPAAFVDQIFEFWKRWKPRVVGIEQAGQQTTRFYFDQKMEEEEIYIRVEPLKPKNRNKPDRIRTSMEPIIRSRRLFMLPTETRLRKMVDEFPDTDPIDELDALAYGTEPGMWRKPFRQRDVEEQQSALKLIINRRSTRTGY